MLLKCKNCGTYQTARCLNESGCCCVCNHNVFVLMSITKNSNEKLLDLISIRKRSEMIEK